MKNLLYIKISIILLILLCFIKANSQTVIEMTYPTDADLVLVRVNDKKDADIIVYRTEDKEEAKQWDCMWKFKSWGFSDFSIFVMNNISDTLLYIEDDYAYKVAGKIYFTSNKEERGYNDPFFRLEGVFRRFKDVKDQQMDTTATNAAADNNVTEKDPVYRVVLNGSVTFDDDNKEPKNVTVKILDSLTINTLFELKPESNGFYVSKELAKGSYYVMVTADGYKPFKELIETVEATGSDNERKQNLRVKLIPEESSKAEVIQIVNNILFYYDRYYLKPESKALLDKISKLLNTNPAIKLEVTGYTDAIGNDEYNQHLSKLRAKSVVDYLIKKGISAERIISKGNGKTNPIAINKNANGTDCPQGRKFNRRVELKFINENEGRIVIENIIVPESYKIKDNRN